MQVVKVVDWISQSLKNQWVNLKYDDYNSINEENQQINSH